VQDRSPQQWGTGSSVAEVPTASGLDVVLRFVVMAWPALWIVMFATGNWQIGMLMLFLTGPVMGVTRGSRRRARRYEKHRRRYGVGDSHRQHALEHRRRALELRDRIREVEGEWRYTGRPDGAWPPVGTRVGTPATPAPTPTGGDGATAATTPPASSTSAAERSLAAVVVRAETSSRRLEPESLALVREVDQVLRPLLAHVRSRGADARVRHDLEGIATEHLPAALDTYLALPDEVARTHRGSSGTTPADELRSQLTLLVEGCRQLRDAVHDADLDRQQELSRFLDAKFRRSDLDL
jgi:hypothetical protein